MKMTLTALCLTGALAFATSAFAQAQPSSDEKKDMGKSMTLTGCLREAAGTPGEYELTNVTGGKTSATEKAATYRLVPGTVDLKAHLGHKVEITGTPEPATGEKAPTSSAAGEQIKVTALKHISPSCDATK
jgi:hypothetical protein